jgi:predicted SprT family Zn-dependent metalloprotease
MNNFSKAFEVILFYLCLICWIESVKIEHFSTTVGNSFQTNQTIDLNCHYNLEDSENITDIVIQHENTKIVKWENNSGMI